MKVIGADTNQLLIPYVHQHLFTFDLSLNNLSHFNLLSLFSSFHSPPAITQCDPNPCFNGGTCSSNGASCADFTCQCAGCYTDRNCLTGMNARSECYQLSLDVTNGTCSCGVIISDGIHQLLVELTLLVEVSQVPSSFFRRYNSHYGDLIFCSRRVSLG